MKVRYIPRAQDDVDEIYEGIAAIKPNRAQRVEHAIRAATELLGRKPGLGVATGHEDARRWPMGVPTISISFDGRRQVFVESSRDAATYDRLFQRYKSEVGSERSLIFI